MTKGIIYVRVSSTDQVQGTSLENQERACVDYAKKNDIEVVRIFVEKGESATVVDRTEFLKALAYCREHKGNVQFFIVWKLDRFARNTDDHFPVRAELRKYGVSLRSVTEPISDGHTGKLMETFLAGYAEFENEVRKQRCTAGMQARLRNGIWCWSPPIGYTNSKKMKDRRKTNPDIPDDERFHLIQKGMRLYIEGNLSITALAKESAKWGLRTRTGRPMRKQLWEVILSDKFYAGILVDPWTGEEYVGAHKAMVTLNEFRLIQKVKTGKSNNNTGRRLQLNPDFPLRRFVLCKCGRPHSASWSKGRSRRYGFYHCKNRKCPYFGKCISKDILERKFCELLLKVTPSVKFLKLFSEIVLDVNKQNQACVKIERDQRQRQIAKLEGCRKELLEMRINGEISPSEYQEMKNKLDARFEATTMAENHSPVEFNISFGLDHVNRFVGNIAAWWESASALGKTKIQGMVLPKGVTYAKSDSECRTTVLSPILALNQIYLHRPSELVAEVGRNWNQIMEDIGVFVGLAKV